MPPSHAFRLAALALGAVFGLSASGAVAGPAATAGSVAAQPSRTTEVFGDWTVVCVVPSGQAGAARRCEAAAVIHRRDGKRAIAKVAIGRSAAGFSVGALLPVNIGFPSTVGLAGAGRADGVHLAWKRCLPGACLAEAPVKKADLAGWERESKPMQLSFVTAAGRKVTLPVSSRGMAQAVAALPKVAK